MAGPVFVPDDEDLIETWIPTDQLLDNEWQVAETSRIQGRIIMALLASLLVLSLLIVCAWRVHKEKIAELHHSVRKKKTKSAT
eukprot:g5478.t1